MRGITSLISTQGVHTNTGDVSVRILGYCVVRLSGCCVEVQKRLDQIKALPLSGQTSEKFLSNDRENLVIQTIAMLLSVYW